MYELAEVADSHQGIHSLSELPVLDDAMFGSAALNPFGHWDIEFFFKGGGRGAIRGNVRGKGGDAWCSVGVSLSSASFLLIRLVNKVITAK
jgi:hypothetical protein